MKIHKHYGNAFVQSKGKLVHSGSSVRHEEIPEVTNRATRRAAMSMKRKQSVANNHAETKRENS
tara:strand:- start:1068 stop:1259 length:192 start_codon:yes stop_codon:yes gene_type:complete